MKRKQVLSVAMALAVGTSSMALAQGGVGTAPLKTPASGGTVNVTTVAGVQKQDAPAASPAAATTSAPAAEETRSRASEEVIETTYRISVGEEKIIPARGARNISSSNPKAVEATVLQGGAGVSAKGVGRGQSDIRVFTEDGVRLYRVIVSGANIEQDIKAINELMVGMQGLSVDRAGDLIVLRGEITTKDDERKYKAILERFDVVDLVTRKISIVEQERALTELQRKLNDRQYSTVKASLFTNPDGEVGVWLTGVVNTDQAKAETTDIAAMYFSNNIISHVSLEKRMVEIDVTMVTVDLNKTNDRGAVPYNNFTFGVAQEATKVGRDYSSSLLDDAAGGADDANAASLVDGRGLFGSSAGTDRGPVTLDFAVLNGVKSVNFLKSKRYTTYYGEQHQAVLSGETAQFQDGATIFVPLVGSENAGLATIETGLSVSVTPEILENTKIRTSVSVDLLAQNQSEAPTFDDGSGGSDQASLQLKKFKSSSVLDCENGQTIVVSGINSNLFGMTKNSTPLLEQIPIVNLVFKQQGRNGQNVRSFFFITPEMPKTFEEAGRRAYSTTGPQAKQYYKGDSLYREGNWAFYLGWAKDVPAPPEPTPFPEDNTKKDFIDKIEF